MEEIWKDIDGFEGLYQISNFGNVKSLNYGKRGYAKIIVPKENCNGYLWVILCKNGKKENHLIHRLVGKAFVDNPSGFPIINHKDENAKNNFAENLEWCTPSYNVRYSIHLHPERLKRFGATYRPRKRKRGVPYKHKTSVVQYTKDGLEVDHFKSIAEVCSNNNWRTSSVLECCMGKRKSAYGYIWRFASLY